MAGVTTAARMGIGAISGTQALAPVDRWKFLGHWNLATNSYIYGIEALANTHGVQDLMIYGQASNQSSQTGWGYMTLQNSGGSSWSNERMRYQGGAIGNSWSGTTAYTVEVYNSGYSDNANFWHCHVQNAFLYDRPKLVETTYSTIFGNQSYNAVGGSVCWWSANQKIDRMYVYDNYGSGAVNYQHYCLYGSIRK